MTVTLSKGPAERVANCNDSNCYSVDVTVANAAPNAAMNYACFDNSQQFWPDSGTIDRNWNNDPVTSDSSGNATWQSQCVWGYWSNSGMHLQVKVNGTSSP